MGPNLTVGAPLYRYFGRGGPKIMGGPKILYDIGLK